MDEFKLRVQHEKAVRAKQLIEDKLLEEAFKTLEKQLLEVFTESKADEKELREDAHKSIRLLKHIRQQLIVVLENGKAAEDELLRLTGPSRVKRIFGR